MSFPLLERELIDRGFFAQFLQKVFCQQLYPDRSTFEVIVPSDLTAQFESLFDALGDRTVPIRATSNQKFSLGPTLQEYNAKKFV